MLLFIIAYLGGVLTILSPCILPVLPFVFARADRSFARSTLPMLAGMAVTFAAVASLAAVGGNWAVNANQYGRYAAMILLALFAVTLLWPAAGEWMARPAVALGNRLSSAAETTKENIASSLLLGVATGLLWTPCAGPILGIVLTGAALQGPNAGTTVLLFGYALGAATSLAIALFAGSRIFGAMKRSLGADVWLKRGLGVLVLAGVVAIFFGLDTGFLAQLSTASTNSFEQALLDRSGADEPIKLNLPDPSAQTGGLRVEGELPPLDGAVNWLNTPPLTREALRGKVVLVDFWTYSCINCLRTLPYTRAWAAKYKDHGLVVLGVHTPEFAFERDVGNVTRATQSLKVDYPVAIDSNYAIWQAFDNHYWPAHYFIDAQGRIRAHHFGEGEYDESEKIIQELLVEAGYKNVPGAVVTTNGEGAEAAPEISEVRSPETYIGFLRARSFVSPGGFGGKDGKAYSIPKMLDLNQWALSGEWSVDEEYARNNRAGTKIAFRFRARDLHLVLGPDMAGKTIRYRVTIDGKPPRDDHGSDITADGTGAVTEERLYQLVRLKGDVQEHTFEIEFLDPGVEAYAFTFG